MSTKNNKVISMPPLISEGVDKKMINRFNNDSNEYVTKELFNAHIKRIDDKINDLPDKMTDKMEILLLKEREYQRNQQKETRRFLWGTIGIGIASIVVSIVLAFVN